MKRIVAVIVVLSVILAGFVLHSFISGNKNTRVVIDPALVQQSRKLLLDTLNTRKNTYLDYIKDANIDYNLKSAEGILVSEPNTENKGYDGIKAKIGYEEHALYEVNVEKEGYYHIVVDHFIDSDILSNPTVEIKVNGDYPFYEAISVDVPLRWKDETKEFGVDSYGDQSLPNQLRITEWSPLQLYNNTYVTTDPLLFKLNRGKNTIEFINKSSGNLYLGKLTVTAPKKLPSYDEYLNKHRGGSPKALYTIDAISYVEKNSAFIRMAAEQNPSVSPFDPVYKKINIIDGGGWNTGGQEISYEVDIKEDGFYNLAFHYMNAKDDFDTFRTIKIDGEIPFEEMRSYAFGYTGSGQWANKVVSGPDGIPYKFYFSKGKHIISLKAENEFVSKSLDDLQLLIDHINQFSLEIRKITGKDIDRKRTWKVTRYIPETASYLDAYEILIKGIIQDLQDYAPNLSGSATLSYLKKALVKLDLMQKEPDKLPLYLETLSSGTGSVTQMLGDTIDRIRTQPMSLDTLYVFNDSSLGKENAGIFTKLQAGIKALAATFTTDKYVVRNADDALNVWVSRPITYVDAMQKLVDSQFTRKTGIKVKISVMPDANKMILANAADQSPDIALGLLSHMPFDFAIRGAAYDLTQFDDFWEVASHSAPGAFIPYILNDGVYAIPETLNFNSLIYRKDIFSSLDLDVPDTWEDVIHLLPSLQRYGMNFYHPIAGGISIKWFYQTCTFIYQYGGSLYTEDGLSANISSPEGLKGLSFLTELFTVYSLPEQVPIFYNSFRYGSLPIGITDFNTYLQVKNAAPEIKNQWGLANYPGMEREDGTVARWYIGNGTGAVIMKKTKRPQESWEFLKWWLSSEVQTEYAFLLQSTYGPDYVWLSGNIDAIKNAPIEQADKNIILEQVKWIIDVPRTPGQYMLERGISDVWNDSVFKGAIPRVAIDKQTITINREIRKKMIEFGFIDEYGNVLKPYVIRDVDWVIEQMNKGRGEAR